MKTIQEFEYDENMVNEVLDEMNENQQRILNEHRDWEQEWIDDMKRGSINDN